MVVEEVIELIPDVLYAIKWQNDSAHSLKTVLDDFTDPEWLRDYLKTNHEYLNDPNSIPDMVGQIVDGMGEIVLEIDEKANQQGLTGKHLLDYLFNDLGREKQPGKFQEVYFNRPKKAKGIRGFKKQIRVYAIKDNIDRYFITGGAIKFSHWMDDHPDSKKELEKLKVADKYLNDNHEG